MIVVHVPSTRTPEREYALSVLLGAFLGLDYAVNEHGEPDVRITLSGTDGSTALRLPDAFLGPANDRWLAASSLPATPLARWMAKRDLPEAELVEDSLPIIFGHQLPPNGPQGASPNGQWMRRHEGGIDLGLDVIGSAFFMLTRYEEVALPTRDDHLRFPANASLAWREGFLDRPIVNEYLEILWACMQRLWPRLQRKKRASEIYVTHDVDWPLTRSGGPVALLKASAADILRRRSPATAVRRARAYIGRMRGNFDHDPHNVFGQLMEISEGHGLRSAFYFITDHTAGPIDGEYSLDDPWIRSLLTQINERGHEIGLHPSYGSFQDPVQIRTEFENLLEVATALDISQAAWGGRQHYLRWEAPTTWQAWNDAGLTYDSTVGYADHAGFRAGTCFEYPTFNLVSRAAMTLIERPLIVMEGTLLGKQYMGLDYSAALEYGLKLRARCLQFGGAFTLLWHNSHFLTKRDFFTYESLLSTT